MNYRYRRWGARRTAHFYRYRHRTFRPRGKLSPAPKTIADTTVRCEMAVQKVEHPLNAETLASPLVAEWEVFEEIRGVVNPTRAPRERRVRPSSEHTTGRTPHLHTLARFLDVGLQNGKV